MIYTATLERKNRKIANTYYCHCLTVCKFSSDNKTVEDSKTIMFMERDEGGNVHVWDAVGCHFHREMAFIIISF